MNPEMLEQCLNNAPTLKKYRNMSPERARFIENITQHIKYYMNEIEYNLRSGLSLINEVKAEGREDSEEFQTELFDIVKNVEQCTTGIQRVLDQDGAPSYYLLHGRIAVFDNGMPIDSFVLHGNDDDDSSSDDSDDEDGTQRIMRRFGIRPAAQISFTITQTGDNISVSPIETVFNSGFPTLTSAPMEEPAPAPVEPVEPVLVKKERKPRAKKASVATASDTVIVKKERKPRAKKASVATASDTVIVKKERKPRAKKALETPVVNSISETASVATDAVPKKRGRPKKVSTETV
jgi:hypothetical protein